MLVHTYQVPGTIHIIGQKNMHAPLRSGVFKLPVCLMLDMLCYVLELISIVVLYTDLPGGRSQHDQKPNLGPKSS